MSSLWKSRKFQQFNPRCFPCHGQTWLELCNPCQEKHHAAVYGVMLTATQLLCSAATLCQLQNTQTKNKPFQGIVVHVVSWSAQAQAGHRPRLPDITCFSHAHTHLPKMKAWKLEVQHNSIILAYYTSLIGVTYLGVQAAFLSIGVFNFIFELFLAPSNEKGLNNRPASDFTGKRIQLWPPNVEGLKFGDIMTTCNHRSLQRSQGSTQNIDEAGDDPQTGSTESKDTAMQTFGVVWRLMPNTCSFWPINESSRSTCVYSQHLSPCLQAVHICTFIPDTVCPTVTVFFQLYVVTWINLTCLLEHNSGVQGLALLVYFWAQRQYS